MRYYVRSGGMGVQVPLSDGSEGPEWLLSQSGSLRRICVRLAGGNSVVLFLHWSDGTNLDELDKKIVDGEPYDRYFAGAVVGSEMPLGCRSCGMKFVGIVADTGNPLLGDIAARLRDHEFIESCPGCGVRWQPHVLHVVEPAR
ncbi:hypothetical protein AB0K09_09875 [Streptomyces sp. NPDC049577]|uniref:hypothetical protein n=1 Tax=Streptomyces sp. NPDC049577 TaxID=3155153 RepID=UPI00343ED876